MTRFHVRVGEGPGPAWSNELLGLGKGMGWFVRGTGIRRVGRRGGEAGCGGGEGSGKEGNECLGTMSHKRAVPASDI